MAPLVLALIATVAALPRALEWVTESEPAPPAAEQGIAPALGPSGDAFYQPPAPLPAGKPGDVIRYRPITVPFPPTAPPARGYLVMYLSQDALGQPIAVTGTVLVPRGADLASTPVVGVGPGTQGLGDSCAASRRIQRGLLYPELYLGDLLRRGWAVATTDYQGLGTPGEHTYVVGRAAGPALIDAVRAAQRLPVSGLAEDAPVAFLGYSQGGGAAGWAAQLQPTYAPELDLVAAAVGGVPADMRAIAASLDGSIASALLIYAASGLAAAYPELRLDRFLTPFGRSAVTYLRTACGGLERYTYVPAARYTTPNPLTTAAWQRRMTENSLGRIAPGIPVYLWHGRADQALPFSQADALRRSWCQLGVDVTWRPMADTEHLGGVAGTGDAIEFLADRFTDKPVAGSC